jgi:hypothetical protein
VKDMGLEANPEEINAVEDHWEIPNKEAAVETIGALKDRSRDQWMAMGYQKPVFYSTPIWIFRFIKTNINPTFHIWQWSSDPLNTILT